MRMAVLNKIRSRKGASITFALLAFLVCAVVSSVLLAAASASTGRYSGLADMDQRYYAVTSAAQLFKDTLDSQEITVVRSEIKTEYQYHTYKKKSDGSGGYDTIPTEYPADAEFHKANSSEYKLNLWLLMPNEAAVNYLFDSSSDHVGTDFALTDKDGLDENTAKAEITAAASKSFLAEAAVACVFGEPKAVAMAYDASEAHPFGEFVDPMVMKTMSITVPDCPELAVSVEYSMRKDGTITFTFSSGSEDEAFQMELILVATVQDNSKYPTEKKTETETVAPIDEDAAKYTERIETVTEKTKTTVITWTAADVKKKGTAA